MFDNGGFAVISVHPQDENVICKKFIGKDKQGNTRKTTHDVNNFVQEAIITYYFTESPYIVNLMGFDLKNRTMMIERWKYSLRRAISMETKWTEKEKYSIFRDVLYALCHMQSRGIIHADIKPSNILYDPDTKKCCVCDLGLSSVGKYAKVDSCPMEYTPAPGIVSGKTIGRDMFALCISMVELFCGISTKSKKQTTPSDLRDAIRSSRKITNVKLRKGLAMMVPDDLSTSPSAMKILKFIFGEVNELEIPKVVQHPNIRLTVEDILHIKTTVFSIAKKYKVQRQVRCFNSLVSFINNPARTVTAPNYNTYIVAALFIYSSLFDIHRISIDRAYSYLSSDLVTRKDFDTAITEMMIDREFIDYTLNPTN